MSHTYPLFTQAERDALLVFLFGVHLLLSALLVAYVVFCAAFALVSALWLLYNALGVLPFLVALAIVVVIRLRRAVVKYLRRP